MRAPVTQPLQLDAPTLAHSVQDSGMDAPLFTLTVYGRPQPAGSKRAMPVRRGGIPTGQTVVIDANRKAASWKQEIAASARQAMGEREPLNGPLMLELMFYLQRPRSHYGSGRNAHLVRDSAPTYPCAKPDATKLTRAVEDALTGVVWHDDAQVVQQIVAKYYGLPERCEIIVRRPQ